MAAAGLSTLGIKFGYAAGTYATKPATFTLLTRINSIGGISLEPEQIDASALEDYESKFVAGRADSGGSFPVTVNVTDETIAEWQTVFALSATQKAAGNTIWFEVFHPSMTNAFYVCAETPSKFPMPELAQNSLETVEINLIINEYKGLDTKVEPTGTTGA